MSNFADRAKPAPAIAGRRLTRLARNAVTGVAALLVLLATVPITSQPAYADPSDIIGEGGLPSICDREELRCTVVKTQCMVRWADGFSYQQWSRFDQEEIVRLKYLCIARLMLHDKRKYDEWFAATNGGRLRQKPDPLAAAEQAREAEADRQAQQERLAQERAICAPGNTVRLKVRTSLWRSHGIGMLDRLAGHALPGQIAQASGVDASGDQCTIAVQSGGETVTGTVPLYGIEAADQPAAAQREEPSFRRVCRKSGWMTVCTNVRN